MGGTVFNPVIWRLLPGLCCVWRAFAQDPFEIHIYEYEPMPFGEYSLEAHLNFLPQGETLRDGTLLPLNTSRT